jgi:hypothetical protein
MIVVAPHVIVALTVIMILVVLGVLEINPADCARAITPSHDPFDAQRFVAGLWVHSPWPAAAPIVT